MIDQDILCIGSHEFSSRLMVGTGKYKDFKETKSAIEASRAEVVTVALRRTNIGQNKDEPNLLDVITPDKWTILPNTAGCFNVEDAVRTCQLSRELLDGKAFVKLEVLGESKNLFPNMIGTIEAARILIEDGFEVLVYCSDDPIFCQELDDMGCVAIMPLASPIGSGLGIINPHNIEVILENSNKPVIVDAGVGTASDATIAMELGCDGVLMNTAIALATDPVLMASSMRKGVISGREAFLAGRMPKKYHGSASSPKENLIE